MYRFLTLCVTVLFCMLSVTAAQTRGPDENREKMQERIELLRKLQMMEKLNLDNKTAEKIFAIRKKYLLDRRSDRQELRRDLEKLRSLLNDKSGAVSDEELKALVNAIREKRKQLRALWAKQYDEVSKILTIRQQAELILFLKEFNHSIRALFHRRGDRRPGMRPAGPGRRLGPEGGFHRNGPPPPGPPGMGPKPGDGPDEE